MYREKGLNFWFLSLVVSATMLDLTSLDTWQSSTKDGAELAVNGDMSSCARTDIDDYPFVAIDLGTPMRIGKVQMKSPMGNVLALSYSCEYNIYIYIFDPLFR